MKTTLTTNPVMLRADIHESAVSYLKDTTIHTLVEISPLVRHQGRFDCAAITSAIIPPENVPTFVTYRTDVCSEILRTAHNVAERRQIMSGLRNENGLIMKSIAIARLLMAVILFSISASQTAHAAFISPTFMSWGFDGSSSAGYAPGSNITPSFNIGGTRTNATQTQTIGVAVYISRVVDNYSAPAVQMGTITATLPGNSTVGPIAKATYSVPSKYGEQPIQRGDYYMILVATGSSATAVKSMKFTVVTPDISVEQPNGTLRADGNSTVTFQTVTNFSTSTRVFTVRNPGNTKLTVNEVNFSGPNSSSFYMEGSTPFDVSGGGSADFTVRFAPQAAGDLTADMSIGSNVTGSKNPYTINLIGTSNLLPDLVLHETRISTSSLNIDLGTTGSRSIRGNERISLRFGIANLGESAANPLSVTITERNPTTGDILSSNKFPFDGTLNAGYGFATPNESIGTYYPGSYRLEFFVDGDSKVQESNESNNQGFIQFTVEDGDLDGDGLPNSWEFENGLNPDNTLGVNGAVGDPDRDGYTNQQEFLGNSNPNLATSIPNQPPVIVSAVPAGSNPVITEEEAVDFSASAFDPNNDPIRFSWRLDGVVKSTTSTYRFETDSNSSGLTTLSKTYAVELRVFGGADVATRSWMVTVNNRNRPPVLQPMSNLTLRPGNTIQLSPVYFDPDNQNAATGDDNALAVTYSDFMSSPTKLITSSDVGVHNVTVSVQDGGSPSLSVQRTFQVNVVNAGVQVISPLTPFTVIEGMPQAKYELVLTSQPTAPVTLTLSTTAPLQVTQTSFVFTPANWATPQTVGVLATNNRIPETDRNLIISQIASSADALYSGIPVSDLGVTIKDPASDQWRLGFFTATELLDSGISGDLADPNQNGIPNLMEYALGGDATGNTTGQKILPQVAMNATGKLQISFDRYVGRNDLVLTVEGADELTGPWEDLARSINGGAFSAILPSVAVSESGEGDVRKTTITDAHSSENPEHPKRFLRLEVNAL